MDRPRCRGWRRARFEPKSVAGMRLWRCTIVLFPPQPPLDAKPRQIRYQKRSLLSMEKRDCAYPCDMICGMRVLSGVLGWVSLLWMPPAPCSDAKPKAIPLRPPVVRSAFPMGARAGTRATVEIEGDFLDRAAAIRCECDDVSAAIRKVASVRLEADFEVSAGATPGPRVVYLETARGTSNRFLFRVTKWNSVVEREPNDAPSEALPLELPVSVEGRISRLTDVDFYRFHAAAGERLAFN